MFISNIHRYMLVLFLCDIFLIGINANDFKNEVTTSATPSSTLQRSVEEGTKTESEGLTKRDIKQTDLRLTNNIEAASKSYDPPPEFYRGPGSTGQFIATVEPPHYGGNYKPSNGFISRPIAFPDSHNANINNNNNNKYNGAAGGGGGGGGGIVALDKSDAHLANTYNTWQHLKDKVGGLLHKKGSLQDRISVGHYGAPEHYSVKEHPLEYLPQHPHYSESVPSPHVGGYYGGGATGPEGIPFDVYGGKNHYASSAGNDYSAYSYSEEHEGHEPASHKGHPDLSQKALLAKSFLIPLASAAVLGIAAALVSNPLLLQLGTVSAVPPGAAVLGKRRRRELTTSTSFIHHSIKSSNSQDLENIRSKEETLKLQPYHAHHRQRLQHHHHHHQKVRT